MGSLKEKALAQVAINLCQENRFKEVALCLEKETYDSLKSCYSNYTEEVRQWDRAIDEQCQRLTEGIHLPNQLRQKIYPWINRVALEYLSYSRRQEVLFGVSRYVLMNIFTLGDWEETTRLNEKKLAERLLEDVRLPILQKYRIACVYCLQIHISQLWNRLTEEEKRFTSGNVKRDFFEETHSLVLLWSRYMTANQEEKAAWRRNYLWSAMVSEAISYGNRAALMMCWKEIQEDIKQKTVIDWALESLRKWQNMGKESSVKGKLVLNQSPKKQFANFIKHFNLPFYYSELMFFFLSQMDEEQQLTFFKKAFHSQYCDQSSYSSSVLECFLNWPHQDDFLPMINRLWGLIPEDKYAQCLLALASKYIANDEKANPDYDYQSLLKMLWKETPQEYKQYMFRSTNPMINEGQKLLSQLLNRSPFQEKDEALFKQIICEQPQGKRRAMMLSKVGENMYFLLIQKEKWSFLNGLLKKCLPLEETEFKKRFIESDCGVKFCLDTLVVNHEKLVEDFLDWSFESDAEKTQWKGDLVFRNACFDACESLLHKGEFAKVECIINFSLSSNEEKEQFKVRFAQRACGVLLRDCAWDQMDTIITWSVDTEKKIRFFKTHLLSFVGIDMHYLFVFIKRRREEVEDFYHWFGLLPREIRQLKKDTVFSSNVIQAIYEDLPEYTSTLADSLRWCLTNEAMVIDLKKKVEEKCFAGVLDREKWKKKRCLNRLVSELLAGFRKEVWGTNRKFSNERYGRKKICNYRR